MNISLTQKLFVIATAMLLASSVTGMATTLSRSGQGSDRLTPIQREIDHQRQRLSSSEVEERRDALMRLGNLKRADASQVAAGALHDIDPMVRVTAAHAVLSLPAVDAATLLIPLLQDKLEFVRRETAYALGETRSRTAAGALITQLADKEAGVRGATAVALGQIGDESAVGALAQLLAGGAASGKKKKSETRENEFVMRAAARSLGQIRSRAGVSALIAALTNDANNSDVRREAATALGLIGDRSAEPALRAAFNSDDPSVSEAAHDALRRLASLEIPPVK